MLCGVNTHACIRMAAVDAYQRDFRVVLAEECVGSYDAEHARLPALHERLDSQNSDCF
ncbi:isochorismatase family protein [Mesorhizobium sp.]|uniref:isochorismatase family protein n=1 Tax=unclassified Mesorhizobium TaxID=325217 RepID=UPI00338FCA43